MQRWQQLRTWLGWLIPRPFYLVSTAFYLGVFAAFLIEFARGQYSACGCQLGWLRLLVMTGGIAAFVALDRLEYRRFGETTPLRAALVLFVVRIAIYEAVTWTDAYRYTVLLTLFLPLLGLWYFGTVVGLELAALACVDFALHQMAVTPNWLSNPDNLQSDLQFLLALIFTLALVYVLAREKASRTRSESLFAELTEAHGELEAAHQQLRLYAEQVEQLATAKERNRLARDIHDSLGHYLTIINVQLEKALSYQEREPAEAVQAVRDAKHLASEALQDVRRSVSALRTTEELFALIPALHTLVDRLHSSRLSVALHVSGQEEGYSKQALMALFRVAQEGFTNVERYAKAAAATIDVDFGEAVATLRLCDDGRGFDTEALSELQPDREGGYGLQGARERLELVGGRLDIDSAAGQGTNLTATIPKDRSARNDVPLKLGTPGGAA
jgi:signal transduction histidine kinase